MKHFWIFIILVALTFILFRIPALAILVGALLTFTIAVAVVMGTKAVVGTIGSLFQSEQSKQLD